MPELGTRADKNVFAPNKHFTVSTSVSNGRWAFLVYWKIPNNVNTLYTRIILKYYSSITCIDVRKCTFLVKNYRIFLYTLIYLYLCFFVLKSNMNEEQEKWLILIDHTNILKAEEFSYVFGQVNAYDFVGIFQCRLICKFYYTYIR